MRPTRLLTYPFDRNNSPRWPLLSPFSLFLPLSSLALFRVPFVVVAASPEAEAREEPGVGPVAVQASANDNAADDQRREEDGKEDGDCLVGHALSLLATWHLVLRRQGR
jgi:hypothetical protein